MSSAAKKVRVVIADDSLVAREMLSQILSSDPQIEVVGQAHDGEEAVDLVGRLRPDLVTMDIHMPKMDGLEATERIMAFTPTPILVVSSSVHGEGMGRAFDALTLGALEVIKKPEPKDWADLERIGREVLRKVKILANVQGHHAHPRAAGPPWLPRQADAWRWREAVAPSPSARRPAARRRFSRSSRRLPGDFPAPVLVAQHIADGFIPGLVDWLNAACDVRVVQAEAGMVPEPGTVYFASTGRNLVLSGVTLRFEEPGTEQLYIPSADTLFESVAADVRQERSRGPSDRDGR